jgi:hypothetical protein
MNKTLSATLVLFAAVLISSSGLLVTHAATATGSGTETGTRTLTPLSSSHQKQLQQLSLNVQGIITNAGNQHWTLSGGNLLNAQLGAESVSTASFQYFLSSQVSGTSASRTFQMTLIGTTTDGQQVRFVASGVVVGMVPSICFPSYDQPDASGNCPSADTSAIPAFFEVAAQTTEILGGGGGTTSTGQQVLLVEAPILSPWGAPIVISSTDGSTNIVTTYTTGHATWTGVQLSAQLSGSLGSQSVSGTLSMTTNAVENFVAGTEVEWGSVSFQGMSISSLNANGAYWGSSSVPTTGSQDCSALAGLPSGTCTETGLTSTGSFVMWGGSSSSSSSSLIQGAYQINWPEPSVTYTGTITATVKN